MPKPSPGKPPRLLADGRHDSADKAEAPYAPDGGAPESGGPAIDNWDATVTRLKEAWQKHEEEWPDAKRPSADRSHDEPGSWRGDSGHYLNAEENLVSDHALQRIGEVEKKTTPALLEIKTQVPGADLVGLQHKLKGEDRFKEKVSAELRAKPERSIALISENMPDAVRYTYQLSNESYVKGYWDLHRSLVDQGYTLDSRRNSWDSSQYKGLNTRWRSPEGQLLEIQFHTPESFEAKQLTHKAYERIRSPVTSDLEREDLYTFQAEVCSRITVPNDAPTIPNYREA